MGEKACYTVWSSSCNTLWGRSTCSGEGIRSKYWRNVWKLWCKSHWFCFYCTGILNLDIYCDGPKHGSVLLEKIFIYPFRNFINIYKENKWRLLRSMPFFLAPWAKNLAEFWSSRVGDSETRINIGNKIWYHLPIEYFVIMGINLCAKRKSLEHRIYLWIELAAIEDKLTFFGNYVLCSLWVHFFLSVLTDLNINM